MKRTDIDELPVSVGETYVTTCTVAEDPPEPEFGIEMRWAWPEDYTQGDIYEVIACHAVYFRVTASIPESATKGDRIELHQDDGKRAVWILTGDRHPTENAVLARWPD
jgi:hypothetical protein